MRGAPKKSYFILCFIIFILMGFFPLSAEASGQCVILLHGLARSHHAMSHLEIYLKTQHYTVINQDYPSTKKTIKNLADQDLPPLINLCLKSQPAQIHFVTHSLGGIVLRQYLQTHKLPRLGRIVMLSPPNQGSPLANLLHDNWLFKSVTGPAGQELTTLETSTPNYLPKKLPFSVGIIAGSFSPFGNLIFHEANDGKVAVSSTKLSGMKDFIVLPVSHTFMMSNPIVMKQVLAFLKTGKFDSTLAIFTRDHLNYI